MCKLAARNAKETVERDLVGCSAVPNHRDAFIARWWPNRKQLQLRCFLVKGVEKASLRACVRVCICFVPTKRKSAFRVGSKRSIQPRALPPYLTRLPRGGYPLSDRTLSTGARNASRGVEAACARVFPGAMQGPTFQRNPPAIIALSCKREREREREREEPKTKGRAAIRNTVVFSVDQYKCPSRDREITSYPTG